MNKLLKVVALYSAIALVSGDRAQASFSAYQWIDLGLKCASLVTVAYGFCAIGHILCDIRDMQLELLINSIQPDQIPSDTVGLWYTQTVDEHNDPTQHDFHMQTDVTLVVPNTSQEYTELCDALCEYGDSEDNDWQENEDSFDDID